MLQTKHLISPIFSLDALLIAGADKTLDIYLHDVNGYIDVAKGTPFSQRIRTLSFSDSLLIHARYQLESISAVVDLDFNEVQNPDIADISIYYDTEINIDASESTTFGITITNTTSYPNRRLWTEIFLNGTDLNTYSSDFNKYVFNHELLHALGIEHTFDNSDGDFYLSTDPQLSSTPEETVMSYRPPISGTYPTDISSSDYSALQEIWGIRSSNASLELQPQSIYRLYQISSANHIFTSNSHEIDYLTGLTTSRDFINEGIAYTVGAGADQELYRFYDQSSGRHFYSASSFERDLLSSSNSNNLIYEGVAFYVFSPTETNQGRTPVLRFYDSSTEFHYYSSNEFEINTWANNGLGWINEGIAWYA